MTKVAYPCVTKITLVRRTHGADILIFDTTLSQGIWPFDGTQSLSTEIARGHAEDWVARNFPGVEFVKIIA